ncbi:16S rRNA (guanine(966)-N(2))-methyltransferase RsmD [Uliginosibacterium sp. H3]|uniref:16S rRNA (Guanine(966)-N(2))-methyltransferase RsmD n=1 Tax=Uliginosibacterium silvisoli TaxID=3114758 RepID=A0ABU6K313_9RHOO|nr:16S rRNA (guanine(966)-N(2))-methyltransferase RsmD [Uliginosibacterium sp. H3]
MSRVRIVGGTHRSRLIEVPDAMGLRPTPDRVRETLFNWLGQDLTGLRCLDLFAGSGALGFEAASRGAAEVTMLEFVPKVFAHLKKTQAALATNNVRLLQGDALKFIAAPQTQRFDLILLDPPYRQGWLEKLAPHLSQWLAPDARLYVEAETALESYAGLTVIKSGKAGQVHYHLLSAAASA